MSEDRPVEPLPYTDGAAAERLGPGWKETVLSAYRWMRLGRALDSRMLALQRQGRVGFYGAATGQEAVNVAAGLVTDRDYWIFPGLREQLVALVRGHALVEYAHHLFADNLDPSRGRNMPCHPSARDVHYVSMSSVIGTQITHAVGLAYALRIKGAKGVSVAFFGDWGDELERLPRRAQLRRSPRPARGVLLHEQPVGDLGTRDTADCGSHVRV